MNSASIWASAGIVFGLSLGLLFVGYLIKPSIRRWEGSATLQKLIFSVVGFVVGSGAGGAVIAVFSEAASYYLLGVGLGIIWGCFHQPVLLPIHTLESVSEVIRISDGLCRKIPDIQERATTTLAVLAPPISSKTSSIALGDELGAALDKLAENRDDDETGGGENNA